MKNHDNEATIYVCTLGPKQVTRPQKQCLLRIANHWTSRYQCTCIAKADLCDDLMIVPRQLRRILSALTLKGIIEYTPGLGAGNWSTFRFPKIGTDSGRKEEAKGTQRGHKRDTKGTFLTPLIRKRT